MRETEGTEPLSKEFQGSLGDNRFLDYMNYKGGLVYTFHKRFYRGSNHDRDLCLYATEIQVHVHRRRICFFAPLTWRRTVRELGYTVSLNVIYGGYLRFRVFEDCRRNTFCTTRDDTLYKTKRIGRFCLSEY